MQSLVKKMRSGSSWSTDIVGKELDVTLYGKEMGLTIIGVEKASEDSMFSFTYENSPIELQIPLITFSTMYGMDTESFWQIMILTEEGEDTYRIASEASNLLERRHQCSGEDIYQVENFSDYMTTVDKVIGIVTTLVSFVAAISLLVGGIGVMNIMLVSVTDVRERLGSEKHLAAKTKSTMLQFLSESAIITLIGGVVGILLGIGGAFGSCKSDRHDTADICIHAIGQPDSRISYNTVFHWNRNLLWNLSGKESGRAQPDRSVAEKLGISIISKYFCLSLFVKV